MSVWELEKHQSRLEKRCGFNLPPRWEIILHDPEEFPEKDLRIIAFNYTRKHNAGICFYDFFATCVPQHLEKILDVPWEVNGDREAARQYLSLVWMSMELKIALSICSGPRLWCIARILDDERADRLRGDLKLITRGWREMHGIVRKLPGGPRALQEWNTSVVPTEGPEGVLEKLDEVRLAHVAADCLPRFLFDRQVVDVDNVAWGGAFQGDVLLPFYELLIRKRPSRGEWEASEARLTLPESLYPVTSGSIAYVALVVSLSLEEEPQHALAEFLSAPTLSRSMHRYETWLSVLRNPKEDCNLAPLLTEIWDMFLGYEKHERDILWERQLDTFPKGLSKDIVSMVPHYAELF